MRIADGTWDREVSLLILLIDSAPALVKAFMSIGKPTLYEQLQDNEQAGLLEHARAHRRALTAAQEHVATAIVDEAEIHRKLWKQALEDLIPEMIDTQREVARRYMDQWSRRARVGARDWFKRACDSEPADGPAPQSTPEPRQVVTTISPNGRAPSMDLRA